MNDTGQQPGGGRANDRTVRINKERLKRAREAKGWKKEKLCEEMDKSGFKDGFAVRTLEELERPGSTGNCKRSTLKALAQVLSIPEDELLAPGQQPWIIPARQYDEDRDPPGSLLLAEMGIVPFHFRTEERAAVAHWCEEDRRFASRLYVGKGGIGKTRLAIELCREMAKKGWRTGFIDYLVFQPDEEEWDAILRDPAKLLLVFDYAENHLEELEWILRQIDRHRQTHIRVLLFARNEGEWWKRLKAVKVVGDLIGGPASSVHDLRPLSLSLRERQESFRLAARSFAAHFKKEAPVSSDKNLLEDYFDRALLLHMDALALVEGVKVEGEDGILDYVLTREKRFWTNHLKSRDLPATLLEGIGHAMAGATYVQGLDAHDDGLELLRVLPFFAGQTADVLNAVNLLLHDCYAGDRWIEPVQPDELGRRLYERTFRSEQVRKAVFKAVAKAAKQK